MLGKLGVQGKCSRCWWGLDQSIGLGLQLCAETGRDPGDLQQPCAGPRAGTESLENLG